MIDRSHIGSNPLLQFILYHISPIYSFLTCDMLLFEGPGSEERRKCCGAHIEQQFHYPTKHIHSRQNHRQEHVPYLFINSD